MGTTMQEASQTNGQRKLRYIELFAGIGGFALALNRLGHTCVWANEWNKYAAEIYNKNFEETQGGGNSGSWADSSNIDGEPRTYRGSKSTNGVDTRDITTVPTSEIPDHDLLAGGFPCQAFSIAGKRRGFDDTRGTLFFEIARILKDKQPKLFILENVKGLLSHDGGNTFKIIISTLTELGYDLQWQVLNSKNFGVPQNRERVFIVGHLRGEPRPQVFPFRDSGELFNEQSQISATLDSNYHKGANWNRTFINQLNNPTHSNDRVYGDSGVSPALNTMQGGRRQPKIAIQEAKIRRLTPLECERLQGFPDGWTEGISDTQRYKCLGNAVTVNVVYEIARRLEDIKEKQ